MIAAVTADIVASRELADRATAQRELERALSRAEAALPVRVQPERALRATVGDELQGVYRDLRSALAATLLQRLALPPGIDLRFGIGLGESTQVPSKGGDLSDGSAWWAARTAVERVEVLGRREAPHARTWVVAAPDAASDDLARIANAGLLTRDRLVGRWSDRARRLVYGRITGATQLELADAEQITQSAVSQTLSAAGAWAVIGAYVQLVGEVPGPGAVGADSSHSGLVDTP